MKHETLLSREQEMSEVTLKRFDGYIIAQVRRLRGYYARAAHPSVLDLEIDELIQRVRIKFWQALESRHIGYPYAYIRRIIHNEAVDLVRKQKVLLPLPGEEELGNSRETVEFRDLKVSDPAEEIEQQIEGLARLHEVIRAILKLPPRQRQAMICSLQEQVDDRVQLIKAFKVHRVDIEGIHWPAERAEKHVMQASLAPARKALARDLQEQRELVGV